MEIIRRCRFRTGHPHQLFILEMWDTGRVDSRGQAVIGYRLGKAGFKTPIFEGEDFAGSPMHADDSDETVASLMNFLTLRPGDTDADYFADYTAVQLGFCHQYAEALARVVEERFGERD